MDDLCLEFPSDGGPAYQRLASALRTSLRDGRLRRGDRLPSTRRLAAQLGLHRHTVMLSLDELVAEGWLESRPGSGYRVVDAVEPQKSAPTTARRWSSHLEPYLEAEAPPAAGARFRFPSGQPDLRRFPCDEYYACVREALRRCPPEELLGYADPRGRAFFRDQLAHYLRRARGLEFGADELVVTHGCQEAIYLLAQLLLRPGDRVAVERLGYPNVWQALRCSGAELVGVDIDSEGIVPESLELALRGGGVKLIYLTPLHQYPTTVTLSQPRRQAVYTLASRYDVAILEDDYDFELHYRTLPVAPMRSHDPEGRVLYCSTFSKVLHASARLGFAVVPAPLATLMARLKRVVSRQNDSLAQEAVAGWMADGGFERHLRRMRRLYETRLETMLDQIPARFPFALPQGGMCLWIDVGCDTEELARRALELDVEIRPGTHFSLDGELGRNGLRLGFAYPTPEEIREGMRRLMSLLP